MSTCLKLQLRLIGSGLLLRPQLSQCSCALPLLLQHRHYARRKGRREAQKKARQAKDKEEAVKEWKPRKLLTKKEPITGERPGNNPEWYERKPDDDVYFKLFYPAPLIRVSEAVEQFRFVNGSDMFNSPTACIYLTQYLDMRMEKKNKYVEQFRKVVRLPHLFEFHDPKIILAICKTQEEKQIALETGATMAGGSDIIKQFEKGTLVKNDFEFIVSTQEMLPELVSLRGYLKKMFPSNRLGSVGMDIKDVVENFTKGIRYRSVKPENVHSYADVVTKVGTLDMPANELEENIATMIMAVMSHKPTKSLSKEFITRAFITCPPSLEHFLIDVDTIYKDEINKHKAAKKEEQKVEHEEKEELDEKESAVN